MDTHDKGRFSIILKALRLQLATVMDGVGGEKALQLLDQLAELKPETRDSLLEVFTQITSELNSKADLVVNDYNQFEEDLYQGILHDFQSLSAGEDVIVSAKEDVVDLNEYRKSKGLKVS